MGHHSGHNDVTEALRKVRYNEIVHIAVNGDSDDNSDETTTHMQICLIPCLNKEQGGIEFNNLVDLVRCGTTEASSPCLSTTLTDQEIVLARELRTNRWFFPMLNDHRRNEQYHRAIEAATQVLVNRRQAGSDAPVRVFDIGSGTGLLSMIAARSLQKALSIPGQAPAALVQVSSVEMSSALAGLATRTIRDNGLSDSIVVLEAHSTAVCLEHPADLCISELLEDGLLGEGWLPAMRDAWQRQLLQPDAVVVPRGARVYAALVQANWLPKYAGPRQHTFPAHVAHQQPCVVSFNPHSIRDSEASCTEEGLIGAAQVVLPVHAEKLLNDGSMRLLSEAVELFHFDVSRGNQIPGPEGRGGCVSATAVADSAAHGTLVWWELDLWEGVTYSTEPGKEPWQDHWHPCLHLFQCSRAVKIGESVGLLVKHDDSRVSVTLAPMTDDSHEQISSKRRKAGFDESACEMALISPERAFQLNDGARLDFFFHAIESALSAHRARFVDEPESGAVVLDVSDFSLGACMAAALGARRVVSLESSSGGLPLTAARVAQLGNAIVPEPGRFDFEILQCYTEQLTLDILGGAQVNILFAEPYYEILEGWHLQEALNFYFTVRWLRSKGLLPDRSQIIPRACRILGCIIESDQLHSAYCACGDGRGSILGLNHSLVNQTGDNFHEFDLSIPIWQYDYTVLSDVAELAVLSYCDPVSPPIIEKVISRAPFHTAGRCDALMVWLEYSSQVAHSVNANDKPSGRMKTVLSTNSQSHRQIVRMLKKPTRWLVSATEALSSEFVCTSWFGGGAASEDHQFDIQINTL